MSARIIAFPRHHRRRHSQEVIDAALRVRSIALDVFEHNDAWHRIEGFEKAIKTLPDGRDNLHRYIAVFGSDPYDLAIRGPSGSTGFFGEGALRDMGGPSESNRPTPVE